MQHHGPCANARYASSSTSRSASPYRPNYQNREMASIHDWQPWIHSTGPRTPLGKRSSTANLPGGARAQTPTLASLKADKRAMMQLWRWHIRNPKGSALLRLADPNLMIDLITGLLLTMQRMGQPLDEARDEVLRVRESELRHAHRLRK